MSTVLVCTVSFCTCKIAHKIMPDGKEKMQKNENENANKEVFNRSVPVDLSVLKGIKQLPSVESMKLHLQKIK